ncbi:MAG: family 16 glycoside hydrolase [Chthoniobacteraceae bacterium]
MKTPRFLCILLAGTLVAHSQEPVPNPLAVLVKTLAKIENPAVQINILRGMNASLKGKRDLAVPPGWDELYAKLKTSPDAEVRQQAQSLAATFGGGAALDEMRKTLADPQAATDARKAALESLVAAKDAPSLPVFLELIKAPGALRAPAIRALAGFEDPQIAPALLGGYAAFDSAEKRDVLNTLFARPATARALLAAVEAKRVDRAAITAPLARQLQSFKDPEIDAWMAKNWGAVRTSSAEKQAQIAKMKEFLSAELILKADASRGRALFSQTCGVCHTMFGTGGKIGPELPGSFEDVDYLLQNIVDPNAIIGKDYQQTFVSLKDGQTVSGIVAGDDASTVTLKTLGDTLTLQRADIVEMKVSEQSMMPEGLITTLDEESVRDLFHYLRQRKQVPMLATALNANDFFNGTDLTRWSASGDGWKVESGEIVGRGNAKHPTALVSEMIAKDFKLSARMKITGANAAAEFVVLGAPRDEKFAGWSLSAGGGTPANFWLYSNDPPKPIKVGTAALFSSFADWTRIEVAIVEGRGTILIDGEVAVEFTTKRERTLPAFYLLGEGAELRVKDLKLEVAP